MTVKANIESTALLGSYLLWIFFRLKRFAMTKVCPQILTAKKIYLNFQPPEIVSRYPDPQPQVVKISHICLISDQKFYRF